MEESFLSYRKNWGAVADVPCPPPSPFGFADPFADLCFDDGRRYRVLIEETCIREGDCVRARFGHAARFVVDFEVILLSNARWSEGGHPQGFSVIVSLGALQSGALEAVGYGEPLFRDRATALLLLARFCIHRHLARSGGGGGYSLHARPLALWIGEEKS